jgi:hypothetical protein
MPTPILSCKTFNHDTPIIVMRINFNVKGGILQSDFVIILQETSSYPRPHIAFMHRPITILAVVVFWFKFSAMTFVACNTTPA